MSDHNTDKCCWRVDGGIWCGASTSPDPLCMEHWQLLGANVGECPEWDDGQHQFEVQIHVTDVNPGDPRNQIKRCGCGKTVGRSQ